MMQIKTRNIKIIPDATYTFEYTNHRGVTAIRTATFINFQIVGEGNEDYYPAGTHCFLMMAHDRNNAYRSFAVDNINFATWKKL